MVSTEGTLLTLAACALCKARKRKCDSGLPACRACAKAGVECNFYDVSKKTFQSRNHIVEMEEKVRELENLLAEGSVVSMQKQRKNHESIDTQVNNLVIHVGLVSTGGLGNGEKLFLGYTNGFQLAEMLMQKAMKQNGDSLDKPNMDSPIHIDTSQIPSGTHTPASNISLPPLPTFFALVNLYIEESEVRHPVFIHSSLLELALGVYNGLRKDSHSRCIVYLVMAISLQMMSRFDVRSISLADDYYRTALTYLEDVSYYHKNLSTLQILLLTVIYSLLNPSQVAIWHMAGIALRMALDIGLHREEILCAGSASPLFLDLKRRIFWTTYAIDRGLSMTIGRPLTIDEQSISTKYPSVYEDACIQQPLQVQQISQSKIITIHWLDLRRLQSEIVTKLYLGSNHPVGNNDPWFVDMHKRLIDWFENAPISAPGPLNREWSSHGFYNAIMLLYRPSPANPDPPQQSYVTSYEAASTNIALYESMLQKKTLHITWIVVSYAFNCAVTLLYMFFISDDVRAQYSTNDLARNIQTFNSFLEEITHRWPAASSMHAVFNRLGSMVLKAFKYDFSDDNTILNDGIQVNRDGNQFYSQGEGIGLHELEHYFFGYPGPRDDVFPCN